MTTWVLVFLVCSLLLQCGDVEQNPGPDRDQQPSDHNMTSPSPCVTGDNDNSLLDGMQKMLQEMFTEQERKLTECIASVRDQVAEMSKSLDTLHGEVTGRT
ncbi:hypothetical protein BaRGS_00028803 [Batillaria attramentaria]|uniref:Secreted protein n=1 Tax=Batillaria attramentaria TaxID=370345 RepID=A0ABD0JY53_9CAEN